MARAFSEIEQLIAKALEARAEQISIQVEGDGRLAKVGMVCPEGRVALGITSMESVREKWLDETGMYEGFPAEREVPFRGRVYIGGCMFLAAATSNQNGLRLLLTPYKLVPPRLDEPDFKVFGCSQSHLKMIQTILKRPTGLMAFSGKNKAAVAGLIAMACQVVRQQNPTCEIVKIEEPYEQGLDLPESVLSIKTSRLRESLAHAIEQQPDILIIQSIERTGMTGWVKEALLKGIRIFVCVPGTSAFDVPKYLNDIGIDYATQARRSFYSGIVFQKHVPRLCPNCKVPTTTAALAPDLRHRLRVAARLSDDEVLYQQSEEGCEACSGIRLGVRGADACTEVVIPDPMMLDHFLRGDLLGAMHHWRGTHDQSDFENFHGRTAFEHGIDKMRRGIFSPQHIEEAFGPMDIPAHLSDNVAQAYEFGKITQHEEC